MAEKSNIYADYKKRIEYLEQLIRAVYRKGVKVDEAKGTVDVTMSAGELEKVVDIERKIFGMKQELKALEEQAVESDEQDEEE